MDIKNILNTPNTTADFDPQDIEINNRLSLLSYLGILLVIPLFMVKKSPYARFHAKQGLNLLLSNIAVGIVLTIINLVLGAVGTGVVALFSNMALRFNVGFLFTVGAILSGILSILGWLLSIAGSAILLALMVIGIINAVKGVAKELPLIGRFHILK